VFAKLSERTALVTGASQGIGRACAEALARAGATTWLAARQRGKLEEVAAGIRAEGGRCDVLELDVSATGTIDAQLQPLLEKGGADILVNNAGITADGLMLRMSDDSWDRVIATNLGGTFRVTRALLRGMAKKRWGRIVNISSVVALAGNPGQVNYCASKAGILGLTRSLAREIAARHVTVNAIAPGYVETAMTGVLEDEQREKLLAGVPAGRMGRPEDIAAGVLYLASEEASYVTGQVLNINGGMYM
jgi:3-oxoacyl-[acyl-carrier protein] reductase